MDKDIYLQLIIVDWKIYFYWNIKLIILIKNM